jgi:MtaA/CmuA family methyltransferase
MNASERVKRRLMGETVDRPPNFNIFMTFAAHFIHQPLSRYYLDYHVLADANQAMVENFAVDLYQAISDPYRETYDLGAQIEFPEDGLPISKIPLVDDLSDLAKLRPPDPASGRRMSDRLEAVRLMRQRSGGELTVMGWVEGALAQAGDLRGAAKVLVDLYDQPEWLQDLLEICCELEIAFALAQVQAGAQIIGLGDALASQISPAMYAKFALPYEQRIFAAIHQAGALGRLHICGNTTRLLPKMLASGADIIDLDWMVDFQSAAEQFGGQVSLCGNVNPVAVMLQGSPEQVYRMTVDCMHTGGSRSFSAAGCEIPDGTPPANLSAQIQALHDLDG